MENEEKKETQDPEQKKAETAGAEKKTVPVENPDPKSAEQDPATPADEKQTEHPASAAQEDIGTIRQELLMAQAQLEALRGGVRTDMAEDAVLLAMHEAGKSGAEVNAEAIRTGLQNVLKRHPDWKSDAENKSYFRVGATAQETKEKGRKQITGTVTF